MIWQKRSLGCVGLCQCMCKVCWYWLYIIVDCTVNPVLSGHLKIDKTNVWMENSSLMRSKVLQNAPSGTFCNTYFWPAFSDNRYWTPIFGLLFEWPLNTGFTVFDTCLAYFVSFSCRSSGSVSNSGTGNRLIFCAATVDVLKSLDVSRNLLADSRDPWSKNAK